ncbi:MAG: glutamate--tRNA ligase [Deltaproteobacteria bacterium]|nr:glutamate--tRNA ligase [Deltaproteobacteria bacterium]
MASTTKIPKIRTRFAPSPTGELHVGGARTALFNYLYAKHHNGELVLRIEDTDTARSKKEFEKAITNDLLWLSITPDESPEKGGDFAPYRQSERGSIYKKEALRLIENSKAYYCYCSKERLTELKASQKISKIPSRYDGLCRGNFKKDASIAEPPVIRFEVPDIKKNEVAFLDGIHGTRFFETNAYGDFIIIGSDEIATYNFAVVIDDALMEITDVIRGDDHLANTPRQVLLYKALGFKVPRYMHLPLVLGTDKTPLSKRHSHSSLKTLKEEGFLPEAIVNSLSRLGWAPGEELMSITELATLFSGKKISKSASVFTTERLRRFNKLAIERSTPERLSTLIQDNFKKTSAEKITEVLKEVKDNAFTLEELTALAAPFLSEFKMTTEGQVYLLENDASEILKITATEIARGDAVDHDSWKKITTLLKEKTGKKGKELFMPLRLALTGVTKGIELDKVIRLLGEEEAVLRLKKVGAE